MDTVMADTDTVMADTDKVMTDMVIVMTGDTDTARKDAKTRDIATVIVKMVQIVTMVIRVQNSIVLMKGKMLTLARITLILKK